MNKASSAPMGKSANPDCHTAAVLLKCFGVKLRAHPDYRDAENLKRLSHFFSFWNPSGLSGRLELVKVGTGGQFQLVFTGVRAGLPIAEYSRSLDAVYLSRASLLPRLQGFAMRFLGAVSDSTGGCASFLQTTRPDRLLIAGPLAHGPHHPGETPPDQQ